MIWKKITGHWHFSSALLYLLMIMASANCIVVKLLIRTQKFSEYKDVDSLLRVTGRELRIANSEAGASWKPRRLSTQKAIWLTGGNGHAFPFQCSEINVFLKNHLNKLTSMFYFINRGAGWLWNGKPEMWYIHLNQLRVWFNSSSFNPINSQAQRKCRAPLSPGLMAFVNQVLNFTNKAPWLTENITSISGATFQKEYFRLFTLRKALTRDWWLQSVYRFWVFVLFCFKNSSLGYADFWCEAHWICGFFKPNLWFYNQSSLVD